MTAAINNLSPNEISQLEQLYTLENKAEIVTFLGQNSFLLPVLQLAPSKIREYFEPDDLVLDYTSDPEYPEDERLFIIILVEPDDAVAYEKLTQLRYNWYFSYPVEVRMKLNIMTESTNDDDEF